MMHGGSRGVAAPEQRPLIASSSALDGDVLFFKSLPHFTLHFCFFLFFFRVCFGLVHGGRIFWCYGWSREQRWVSELLALTGLEVVLLSLLVEQCQSRPSTHTLHGWRGPSSHTDLRWHSVVQTVVVLVVYIVWLRKKIHLALLFLEYKQILLNYMMSKEWKLWKINFKSKSQNIIIQKSYGLIKKTYLGM